MSDLIERLRMLKEIAGIEGGCIGDAAADRIAELEAEVTYLRTRDKSQGAYIEQVLDKLEAENEELEAENERLQARVEALANFNPDWDMLEATQESLREHMQIIRKLNDGIEGLTRANEALIETNKELTTEAREAFAAGFKARHETPDINRAWEDWYTRQNTEQGESDE